MYDIGLLDGLKQRVSLMYITYWSAYNYISRNVDQIGQFKVQWNGADKFGQQMSSEHISFNYQLRQVLFAIKNDATK